jgi:hypothetical protein
LQGVEERLRQPPPAVLLLTVGSVEPLPSPPCPSPNPTHMCCSAPGHTIATGSTWWISTRLPRSSMEDCQLGQPGGDPSGLPRCGDVLGSTAAHMGGVGGRARGEGRGSTLLTVKSSTTAGGCLNLIKTPFETSPSPPHAPHGATGRLGRVPGSSRCNIAPA